MYFKVFLKVVKIVIGNSDRKAATEVENRKNGSGNRKQVTEFRFGNPLPLIWPSGNGR